MIATRLTTASGAIWVTARALTRTGSIAQLQAATVRNTATASASGSHATAQSHHAPAQEASAPAVQVIWSAAIIPVLLTCSILRPQLQRL
jgi:hypothetical protein